MLHTLIISTFNLSPVLDGDQGAAVFEHRAWHHDDNGGSGRELSHPRFTNP